MKGISDGHWVSYRNDYRREYITAFLNIHRDLYLQCLEILAKMEEEVDS